MKTTLHLMNDRKIIASADATEDLSMAFNSLMDALIEDADTNYVCDISDAERLVARIMKTDAEDAKLRVSTLDSITNFYTGDPATGAQYYSVAIQKEVL